NTELSAQRDTALLRAGTLKLTARLTESSNNALVGAVHHENYAIEVVYKPIALERPLWDFPDGTLAHREVASYLIGAATTWRCVPPTVIRDGPFGPGMVQQWIHNSHPDRMVDVFSPDDLPAGWLAVLQAETPAGSP